MAVITINVRSNGHDWGAPNLDGLGIFYIVLAVVYALVVLAGLFALWLNRDKTPVRLRSVWVIAPTVLLLLTYCVWVVIVYPLNGLFKCGAEYWVMSCFFPTSIALFQASNVRLLSYYHAQQELAGDTSTLAEKKKRVRLLQHGPRAMWKHLDTAQKTYCGIAAGLVIQLIVTFILYFGSRKFGSKFGFFGERVDAGECRRGLEWIPSVFWQFLWATVFGPYVLLRIRHIDDTHFWAWQTRLAIIACLPGTPLWLAFLYSNNATLLNVNKWFVPAGWFLPGLATMQFGCIFFPLLDVYRSWKQNRHRYSDCSTLVDSNKRPVSSYRNRDLYSMASLEMQIEKNVEPLLKWAAQKEFTAENIVFLRAVRDFKKKWVAAAKRMPLSSDQERERYEEAALIFFTLVDLTTAKFNINVDHRTYLELSQVFASCKYHCYDDEGSEYSNYTASSNNACPWDNQDAASSKSDEKNLVSDVDKLYPVPVTEIMPTNSPVSSASSTFGDNSIDTQLPHIPPTFSLEVFDKAFALVKHDVYLNTWVRFVDIGETESVRLDGMKERYGWPYALYTA